MLRYKKIIEAVDFGWYNVFISDFNISIENKNILENDGYFVDTRYKNGFQVRWLETDIDCFLDLIKSNKEHAKIKVDDGVIEKYINSSLVTSKKGVELMNIEELQKKRGSLYPQLVSGHYRLY